jgi:WASH complex subunit 7
VLITEIGNALGYVRMVRSAAMYYCSEAAKYLPELDPSCTVSFEACAGSGTFTPPATYLSAGAWSEDSSSSPCHPPY